MGGHLFKIISHQGQIKICPVCDDNIKTYVHIYGIDLQKREAYTLKVGQNPPTRKM